MANNNNNTNTNNTNNTNNNTNNTNNNNINTDDASLATVMHSLASQLVAADGSDQVAGLASIVEQHERHGHHEQIVGDKWVSIRMDGSDYCDELKVLRRHHDVESCYSQRFVSCMHNALKGMMKDCNALIGYCQADELVILVAPQQTPHRLVVDELRKQAWVSHSM